MHMVWSEMRKGALVLDRRRVRGLVGAVLLLLPALVGCNKYEKLLRGTDVAAQYAMGLQFYEKGKYSRAQSFFERCAPLYRVSRRADSLGYYLSNCYYHNGDYVLAASSFDQIATNYPNSAFAAEACYMSAYSLYEVSPRPDLDQEYTKKAILGFQRYVESYPKGARAAEAVKYIDELHGKLVRKEYLSAKLYYHQRDYRAAVAALRYTLEEYPRTPYREELLYMLSKSAYLLSYNSVEAKKLERYQYAVDAYLSFLSEFPESKYIHELSGYYKKAMGYLDKEPNAEFLR